MAIVAWEDQNGDSIVDQNGVDIQFKKTTVQLNAKATFTPTASILIPISAKLEAKAEFKPNVVANMSASSRLIITSNFDPQVIGKINKWKTIMVRFKGDREV